MSTLWILLLAADVATFQPLMDAQHKQNAPNHQLSITWNVAKTQALVKITGGKDAGWGATLKSRAVKIYDESNHHEIFAWFYTPEWQAKDE